MKKFYTVSISAAALFSAGMTWAVAADMDKVLFELPVRYNPNAESAPSGDETISGFAEGSFGYSKLNDIDLHGTTWALRGTTNIQMDTNWNIQIDGSYSRASIEDVDIDALVGAAHAYYRVPDAYAVGAFVQASRFGSNVLDLLASVGADSYATDVVGGGEAAIYTDMATLYGQLGFGRASYTGFNVNHYVGKIGTRLYATDNLRFDLEGSLNRFSAQGGNVNVYSFSGIGNYRFEQMPVSVFAGYRYDRGTAEIGGASLGSLNAHNFLAGLRFHFGSGSLKDEERKGPVWSPTSLNL